MSTTAKKSESKWSKDDASVRIIPATVSPADKTAIDLIQASQLPKAAKQAAIAAIESKSGSQSVHLVRHADASVEPLVCIGAMRTGVKVSHVHTMLNNAEFLRKYIAEQTNQND